MRSTIFQPLNASKLLDICASTPAQVVLFPDIPSALNGDRTQLGKAEWDKSIKEQSAVDHSTEAANLADPGNKKLPCDLCLTKVSPLKVDNWLAKLEETARSGDNERLMAQLNALRSELRGSVDEQYAAN